MRGGPVSPVAAVLSESWGTGGPGRRLGQVIPLATHPGRVPWSPHSPRKPACPDTNGVCLVYPARHQERSSGGGFWQQRISVLVEGSPSNVACSELPWAGVPLWRPFAASSAISSHCQLSV
ncbi:hypothetical protein DPEC_G00370470 [Dallia pectoralis]|nr:hypothetical protein DPEC_G00370470 [Dallia pectoralis]